MKRLIAMLLSAIAFTRSGDGQSLTIYTEINEPSQYLGEGGRLTGLAVETVQELQRRTGNTDPIHIVPWARGYQELQSLPNVVLFSTARTAERDPLFQWVGPLVETSFCLYVRSDSRITLTSLEDAKKLNRIGVYRDDARDLYLTKAGFTNLDRAIDNVTNVKKLMAGRIDAFAASSVSVAGLLKSAGYPTTQVREAFPFLRSQYFIAFSKTTPDATVKAWAAAFEAMKKDRTFSRIYRKYYPHGPLPGPAITSF